MHTLPSLIRWRRIMIHLSVEATQKPVFPYPLYTALMDAEKDNTNTVKPVNTGMPWGQNFIPVWTGSGLDRVIALERNKQR